MSVKMATEKQKNFIHSLVARSKNVGPIYSLYGHSLENMTCREASMEIDMLLRKKHNVVKLEVPEVVEIHASLRDND